MKVSFITLILFFLFLISSKVCAQWQEMYNSVGLCLTSDENNNVYFGTWFAGVNRSTDYGLSWSWTNFFPGNSAKALTSNGSRIFGGATNIGVYLTTNEGTTWVPVNNGITNLHMGTLLSYGSITFAGNTSGVFVSTDYGANWSPKNNGFTSLIIYCFAHNGNTVYAGTAGGLFFTTNNGDLWLPINNGLNTNFPVTSIVFSNNSIFAGTYRGGVYRSTNNGTLWLERSNGMTYKTVTSMAISGNYLFALTDTGGIYFSSDYGENWILKNEGLSPGLYTYSLLVLNNYIFLGQNPGVWRRTLSEITGIQPAANNIPEQFTLYQNYPNPFNPGTKISYDLPSDVNVKIVVYDVLGQEVRTLVNEKQNSGKHEIVFDASNYPSGVYYYRLETGNSSVSGFAQTRKMVLIK